MAWRKCDVCGEYDIFDVAFMSHRCKPAWECRLEHEDDDCWRTIRATDSESAAAKYAEHYDCEGGEYSIVGNRFRGDVIVLVRKDAEDEPERWRIEAETVSKYYAHKVTDPTTVGETK